MFRSLLRFVAGVVLEPSLLAVRNGGIFGNKHVAHDDVFVSCAQEKPT